MKKYGIYLSYPPAVDLRAEGLGRQLAEFIKGANSRDDVRFVVACPSWSTANLYQLFEACGIPANAVEVIAPDSKPLLLVIYQKYDSLKNRKKSLKRKGGLRAYVGRLYHGIKGKLERRMVGTRNVFLMLALGSVLALVLGIRLIVQRVLDLAARLRTLVRKALNKAVRIMMPSGGGGGGNGGAPAAQVTLHESFGARLYRLMEENEALLMRELIDARKDIAAWYSPTAFWPDFNKIATPRLMCVPDVVMTEFPTGFARLAGDSPRDNFKQVENAITSCEYFITYSDRIKWNTLVSRYRADPDNVFVIPHGANRLDDLVCVTGFPDNEAATDTLCRNLLRGALRKDVNGGYANIPVSSELRFVFYASQFRPNKNVMTLLRAYDHLLKRRFISHKLILTGDPRRMDELKQFISENNLENDVLCLHGLSEQELAACYRLADLAVNPSLSEGGCPFTFTEALSVGTPALMARIPVTEEVIVDQDLLDLMCFDPYSWKDMARKMEWALQNRALLLERQKPYFDQLAQRTWKNVVGEYVAVLDRISSNNTEAVQ